MQALTGLRMCAEQGVRSECYRDVTIDLLYYEKVHL